MRKFEAILYGQINDMIEIGVIGGMVGVLIGGVRMDDGLMLMSLVRFSRMMGLIRSCLSLVMFLVCADGMLSGFLYFVYS